MIDLDTDEMHVHVFFFDIDMAYLKNWRRYHSSVHALAQSSSSEDDENPHSTVGVQLLKGVLLFTVRF